MIIQQKRKAVVTPQWLRDCVGQKKPLPCEEYVALQELRTETAKNCPDCNLAPCACSDSESETEEASRTIVPNVPQSPLSSSTARLVGDTAAPTFPACPSEHGKSTTQFPANLLPPRPPIPTQLDKPNHMSRYACQRASPLVCPNQELVREFDIMYRSRALEGEERSGLSYERAISVIKGPYVLSHT